MSRAAAALALLFTGIGVAAVLARPAAANDGAWLEPKALFVSHSFNPVAIRPARAIEAVYQNVLSPWIEATARGTLNRIRLNVDITIEPQRLYETTVFVDGDKHELIVTSPPGFYPAGQIIRTNSTSNTAFYDARALIEDAVLNEEAFVLWLTRRRELWQGSQTPVVALDWERSWLRRVLDPAHPGHEAAVLEGARALDIAHEFWPEAAVSFYGSPWGTSDPSEAWEDEMVEALQPILARIDWLAPTLYDKLKDSDSTQSAVQRERNFHESSLALACRVAEGRPILPWVRHRHYNPAAPYHNAMITQPVFMAHLRWIWNFSDHGETADGFVFWYRDRDTWEQSHIPPPEAGGQNVEQFLSSTEWHYNKWMQIVMHEKNS